MIIPDANLAYQQNLEASGHILKHSIPRMVLGPEPPWMPSMIYNRGAGYCG